MINEEERQKAVLNYLFFPAIYFLVIKTKSSLVVFHARQALVLFLFWILGNVLLGIIPAVRLSFSPVWNIFFFLGWLFLIVKAYQGEEYKIPWLMETVWTKLNKLNKRKK